MTVEEIILEFNLKVDSFQMATGVDRDKLVVLLPCKYFHKLRTQVQVEIVNPINTQKTDIYICGVKTIPCNLDEIYVSMEL